MLKITLNSGLIGKMATHKAVVKALGLRKFGSSVVHQDSPTIRGMVHKVRHLITVSNVNDPASSDKKKVAEKANTESKPKAKATSPTTKKTPQV